MLRFTRTTTCQRKSKEYEIWVNPARVQYVDLYVSDNGRDRGTMIHFANSALVVDGEPAEVAYIIGRFNAATMHAKQIIQRGQFGNAEELAILKNETDRSPELADDGVAHA